MEKEKRNRSGWIFLISFIGLILTMVFLHEKNPNIPYFEGKSLIENAILFFFALGTLGGGFLMGIDYWKSTLNNVAILKDFKKTPEVLEEYYQVKAKAVFKVGISIGIASLMVGILSHFIPELFGIAEATLLFGLVICLLSLVPKSLAKQILKQSHK
ncbi:hypothetical protein HMPREF3103_08620 [Granulicatella sp. HMSC30F09]|jgi:hypothetical protein|uniref:hypothetical protein n=1 Tax=Granulicatella TaxID=117563 RepID=UPI0008A35C7A|nr:MULTISPECIES: hypothetical protein [Granulicatella]MCT2159797.1 hypothetical protein [Granulicatella adiacens]OFT78472.1 hypothetical protein HMPREF3103_08620 [Granulicatella sp. HMSC30F09]